APGRRCSWFSFLTSQARQIGDQVIDLPRRERLVTRHSRNAELFFQLLEFGFAEGMELQLVVAQLDGERILVDSHAAKIAPVASGEAARQELSRQGCGRTDKTLAQIGRATARADFGQFGARHPALPTYNVTTGASFRKVKLSATTGVAGQLRGFDTAERTYVAGYSPDLAFSHLPRPGHFGPGYAVSDHPVERHVIFAAS